MNKMKVFYAGLVLLVAMALFGAPLGALAAHTGGDVTLLNAGGSMVNANQAYSPKVTCGATGKSTANCHSPSGTTPLGHNYGSGVSHSTHVQGVLDAANNLTWQANDVTSFAKGVSVGYHMNQGRNEDYSNVSRATYNDPFFTSSPGMFGKY